VSRVRLKAHAKQGPLQGGLGDNRDRNRPIQIINLKSKQASGKSNHTIVIDLDDNVWTFGNNHSGQLGLGDEQNINRPM
jgi:alpha-tubulin suppressor-like RCC1 family protein